MAIGVIYFIPFVDDSKTYIQELAVAQTEKAY